MKRILFLLLLTVSVYGQNPSRFAKIQITGNANSGTATKVNVQEANGEVNTQTINNAFNKNFGLNSGDVVGATTLLNQYSTTPIDWIATNYASGQVVFYAGKQWIAKIATVAGDVPAVSSKWEEITFEALANKTTTVDQTIIDGSTNAVSSNAVFDALATKAPISSVHNPVTLGTANGLSLDTQQLSLGLASSSTTGALSGTDWNTFNNKENAFSKNTAFNKPFGITAGTVVEGGTLGSNAYTSTAYLPLSGGTLTGVLNGTSATFSSSVTATKLSVLSLAIGTKTLLELGEPGYVATNYGSALEGSSATGLFSLFNYNAGVKSTTPVLSWSRVNSNMTFGGAATFASTVTASPATLPNQVVVKSQLDAVAARPYKVYTALFSQSGINAPVATVLENTTGLTMTWSRAGNGLYSITPSTPFTTNKAVVFLTRGTTGGFGLQLRGEIGGNVVISQTDNSNGVDGLSNCQIEIRVYP